VSPGCPPPGKARSDWLSGIFRKGFDFMTGILLASATLGGGCFWCLDAIYRDLKGVRAVISGYAGGHVPNPGYQAVCSGRTGHAEVVRIEFDPARIAYRDLLEVFFTVHDPTTLNRQGADTGTQYRSIILTHDASQERVAREVTASIRTARIWPDPIVTEIKPLDTFYPAEAYHQDYMARNPVQPYCVAVIAPKVAKFRKQFMSRLKEPTPHKP